MSSSRVDLVQGGGHGELPVEALAELLGTGTQLAVDARHETALRGERVVQGAHRDARGLDRLPGMGVSTRGRGKGVGDKVAKRETKGASDEERFKETGIANGAQQSAEECGVGR